MEKRKATTRVAHTGPGSDLFGELGAGPAGAELATVIHGTYAEALPVAQMSVAQVRRRFGDLLDIHPQATAVLDGVPVEDDVTVQAGQNLMFVRRAGEKGGPAVTPQLDLIAQAPRAERAAPDTVTITGDRVQAVSPEGEARSLALVELIERVAPPRIDTCGTVLPDGVKCVIPIPMGAIFVHQSAPRVHSFEWIDKSSPEPCGKGTRYRKVSLALPYLIVLAVFDEIPGEAPRLAGRSECFFSNRPLDHDGVDTELHFPALLNCSRFPDDDASKPLSWICVQHLPGVKNAGELAPGAAIRAWLAALLRHLLESGFNLSSEQHEVSSWFSETVAAGVDARVASVEAWEQASAEDPLFALEVPWLPSGRTLAQIAQRIGAARGRRRPRFESAGDLMRAIFQTKKRVRRTR